MYQKRNISIMSLMYNRNTAGPKTVPCGKSSNTETLVKLHILGSFGQIRPKQIKHCRLHINCLQFIKKYNSIKLS